MPAFSIFVFRRLRYSILLFPVNGQIFVRYAEGVFYHDTNKKILKTERVSLVKSRRGQGVFRENLIEKYKSCIITRINIPNILVASHIKPWAACSNSERLDVNNGLLLSATYDRLFDSGLISFKGSGEILLSKYITDDNREKLGIKSGITYNLKYSSAMKDYLEYHEEIVFIKKFRKIEKAKKITS